MNTSSICEGQIVPMKYDIRNEDSIAAAIAKSNVIINVVGGYSLCQVTLSLVVFLSEHHTCG